MLLLMHTLNVFKDLKMPLNRGAQTLLPGNPTTSGIQKDEEGNLQFDGYTFAGDSYANQMSYLFAGDDGEAAAKKILEESEAKYPIENPDMNLFKRKQFVEEQVKNRAEDVDKKFRAGLSDIFAKLDKGGKDGEGLCKDDVVALMQGLGLNVDPDNVQTHYQKGPPTILLITWVNRPAPELKNENSNINKLAEHYKNNCLSTNQEKETFKNSWDQHKQHSLEGGPKIPKAEFDKQSKQLFEDKKASILDNNPGMQAPRL
jgi:hypothetical protein